MLSSKDVSEVNTVHGHSAVVLVLLRMVAYQRSDVSPSEPLEYVCVGEGGGPQCAMNSFLVWLGKRE